MLFGPVAFMFPVLIVVELVVAAAPVLVVKAPLVATPEYSTTPSQMYSACLHPGKEDLFGLLDWVFVFDWVFNIGSLKGALQLNLRWTDGEGRTLRKSYGFALG